MNQFFLEMYNIASCSIQITWVIEVVIGSGEGGNG